MIASKIYAMLCKNRRTKLGCWECSFLDCGGGYVTVIQVEILKTLHLKGVNFICEYYAAIKPGAGNDTYN